MSSATGISSESRPIGASGRGGRGPRGCQNSKYGCGPRFHRNYREESGGRNKNKARPDSRLHAEGGWWRSALASDEQVEVESCWLRTHVAVGSVGWGDGLL
jgi:hypothetical protein